MATKLCKMITYLGGLLSIQLHDFLSRGLVRSRDNLKLLYLHYHNIYGYKTRQDGDLPCLYLNYISLTQCLWLSTLTGWSYKISVSFHNVTRFLDLLQGQINYFNCCTTITIRPMTTKLRW